MRPRTGTLRFEITAALLIKVMLLIGLWFLIFRYGGKPPDPQPDIAEHFRLPAASSQTQHPASKPTSPSETPHVR
jgi:hypothetical protein